MSSLSLHMLNKSFEETKVLHDIELEIQDGEFVVLVGPSGCGKSTLLRLIAGLEKKTTGEIVLDGEEVGDVPAADRGLAMVFQSYALYPHMTVFDNMAFALENAKTPRDEIEKTVARVAKMLRLDELLRRKPAQLSGGQRQRVAIGRAMVRDPKIFLFDEPLSNLDAELRVAMRKELASLHAEISTTMIYVTHDQVEAMTMADRIVVMRDGFIEQVGTPLEVYNYPENEFVAGFIGSPRMNFIDGKAGTNKVELASGTNIDIKLPVALKDGEKIKVGIRPEHITMGTGQNDSHDLRCIVGINEQLGGESYIYCEGESTGQITVHSPGQNTLKKGDAVHLHLPPELIHLFDENGRCLTTAEKTSNDAAQSS